MKISLKHIILSTIALTYAVCSYAYVELPDAITDNMVLQQNDVTGLWGNAKPGGKITITTSWDGKNYCESVEDSGKWSIKIKTPSAGGPYTIKFDDGETRTLRNIMIGEVWLCSGQSNMEMPLAGWGKVNDYQKEIKEANYPMIRILKVKKSISTKPQTDFVSNSMGWQQCTPTTIAEDFSAAAYFFAKNLQQKFPGVAIGLVDATWGGTVIESWCSAEAISRVAEFADTLKSYQSMPEDTPLKSPNKPALLFNAMIHPFLPVAFRGVIWYQGESNNRRAYQYRRLFPLMIEDWRHQFARSEMPFIYVQLANYMATLPQPQDANWAELREAQSMALSLPNTGMAVTIDIGDTKDIHPKNKQEVGRRLALIALAKVYGHDLVYQGPVFNGYTVKGDKIVVRFDHQGTGLQTSHADKLEGFAIAGSDKQFYWADASIKGDKVIVSSKKVKRPIAVRYAWANNPVCNLINGAGLPASPFRTDDWPGLTVNAK